MSIARNALVLVVASWMRENAGGFNGKGLRPNARASMYQCTTSCRSLWIKFRLRKPSPPLADVPGPLTLR